mgnify:CR=1 FL=1
MLDDKGMNALIEKCKNDPEFKKVFDHLMVWSQRAAACGMTVTEMASVCMTGYAVGEDPELQEMIQHMLKISKMGLDIVDK